MVIYISAISQAADELREQEVQQKNDEIQQKSAQLEQTQVLNPVLMQVSCVALPILFVQQDHNAFLSIILYAVDMQWIHNSIKLI